MPKHSKLFFLRNFKHFLKPRLLVKRFIRLKDIHLKLMMFIDAFQFLTSCSIKKYVQIKLTWS